VILAGGSGSRLWPLSRQNCPKQFIDPLGQGLTLLRSTIERARACSIVSPLVVASQDHRFLLSQQLSVAGIGIEDVLLESESKNTASSVLLAALEIESRSSGAVLLIMPSDHYISDDRAFSDQILNIKKYLKDDELALLGVKPLCANPNYGYLKIDSDDDTSPLNQLIEFIEKPSAEYAQDLVDKKGCCWNSGMIMAKATCIVNLFERHQPALTSQVKLAYEREDSLFDFRLIDLSGVKNISFDYAILEKEKQKIKASMLQVDWDDIGTWPSLISRRKKLGLKDMTFGSGRSRLYLTDKDIVLVEADDLIMVADVDQLSDMAAITDHLAATNQTSLLNCIDVHRPWGSFKVLAQGSGFLVKQLTVLPEQKISLQSHQCRVENWVVVSGIASVQLDGCESELVSGQSLRVGTKQIHRLLNKQTEVLQVIEVQTGLSLDESDIVRYDDEYLRHLKK
jgi:mannose-1-phosphate guanylyltransferase/mannose-6-phosphate isomerase